jgi:DNA-binding transcriptional regulator YiaG
VKGYFVTSVFRNHKQERAYIHRLVATSFVDNPDGKKTVNHKDGDKHNNRYTNLEWLTHEENTQDAHRTGLIKYIKGENTPQAKLTNTEVYEIRKKFSNGSSHAELADYYRVSKSCIRMIVNRKRWKHI